MSLVKQEIKEGVVKFFNESKGFGFINCEEISGDIFVYRSDINKNKRGLRTLSDDQIVKFELEESSKGLKAINVTPL